MGTVLAGCNSLNEVEKAEQVLLIKKIDLNATQYEITQVGVSLLMLPKDSPPILDLSRRKDQLNLKLSYLQKGVLEAETQLAALKQSATAVPSNKPPESIPPALPPPTKPGQPAVDPNTGLPAASTPKPEPKPEPKP